MRTSVGTPERRPDAGAPGSVLPALLIVALLLCHGVLGFAQQVSACHSCGPAEVPGLPGAHHAPATDAGGAGLSPAGPQGDDAPSGPGNTGYFAAMVALFGTALLGLLTVAPKRCEAAAIRRSVFRSLRPPAYAPLPRGPFPPLLQAFRL